MATDYGVTNGLGREIQALESSNATLPQGQDVILSPNLVTQSTTVALLVNTSTIAKV